MSEKRTREKAGGAGAGPSEHPAKRPHEAAEPSCPFLHTVDRSRLDFDSQHVCSVTMSPVNVYACLVCGSFFRGKSASTPAHAHALDSGHQVFMRLKDGTAWCLPDGYAVPDPSLNDIRRALLPSFDAAAAAATSLPQPLAKDAAGDRFLPGLPGVGNLGASDYASVVVHLLARVEPLRQHFLVQPHTAAGNCHPVVTAFGDLMRRMWSPHALRATCSPHAFMATVAEASDKRFTADTRSESVDFLLWLLRQLHTGLLNGYPSHDAAMAEAQTAERRLAAGAGATGKSGSAGRAGRSGSAGGRWREAGGLGPGRSVVTECFEGEVRVWTLVGAVARRSTSEAAEAASSAVMEAEHAADEALWTAARQGRLPGASITEAILPTQLLSLDLPPVPLFRDAEGAAIIPQIPLTDSLAKFAGVRSFPAELRGEPVRRRYRLLRAPRYLLLHARRFSRNGFFLEKNPTIVTFPLRGLSLAGLVDEAAAASPTHPASGPALARAAEPSERSQTPAASTSSASSSSSAGDAAASGSSGSAKGSANRRRRGRSGKLPASSDAAAALPVPAARELCRLAGLGRDASSAVDRAELRELSRRAWGRVCGLKFDLLGAVMHGSGGAGGGGGGGGAGGASEADDASGAAVAVAAAKARRRAAAAVAVVRADRGSSAYVGGAAGRGAVANHLAAAADRDAATTGRYRCAVLSEAAGRWFQADDLDVREVLPQSVAVSEAYLLLYRQGAE